MNETYDCEEERWERWGEVGRICCGDESIWFSNPKISYAFDYTPIFIPVPFLPSESGLSPLHHFSWPSENNLPNQVQPNRFENTQPHPNYYVGEQTPSGNCREQPRTAENSREQSRTTDYNRISPESNRIVPRTSEYNEYVR